MTEPKDQLWKCTDLVDRTIYDMPDQDLRKLERWLRDGGDTQCPIEYTNMFMTIVRAEVDKRGLAIMPDAPRTDHPLSNDNSNLTYQKVQEAMNRVRRA